MEDSTPHSHSAANVASVRPVRVATVDDHSIIRAVFRTMTEDDPNLTLIWSAPNLADAREFTAKELPDLILMDVTLPDGESYGLIREIKQHHPQVAILVVSMHEEEYYVRRAMESGANGYAIKSNSPDTLLKIMQQIIHGGSYFPGIA